MLVLLFIDEMYVHSMSNKRVQIQLVGKHKVEEKLKRLDEICSMSTAYLGVSSVGSSHEITALVPSKFLFGLCC